MEKISNFFAKVPKPWLIGGSITAGVLLLSLVIWLFIYTSTRNEGRTQEEALSAQWSGMQARYGQNRLTVADQLGIAREKTAAINEILAKSASGRYDKASQPGVVDQKALLSAVAEAYPDLDVLKVWDTVMTNIQATRERFAADQKKMQDMIRSYETWRTTGQFYHPAVVRYCGFPSVQLKARVGDKILTGPEALEKMSIAIVDGDTRHIFDTGVDTGIKTK